jgi:hypothetical protein
MLLKLTNNWTARFLQVLPSQIVDESVRQPIAILSSSDKADLANTPELSLVEINFSLEFAI